MRDDADGPTRRSRRRNGEQTSRGTSQRKGRRRAASHSFGSKSVPRASVIGAITSLPSFVRLLVGLMSDPRVATSDKLLVAAAVGYVIMPVDMIPDFIPLLGYVDDVFLVAITVRRLIRHAGREVIMDHWSGHPRELQRLDLEAILMAAALFLPRAMKRRLVRMSA